MEENFKRYLGYIPYLIPFIYFLGFITVNGYLATYNYSDYTLFNTSYLKAGLIISIIYAIIFLTIWFSFTQETMSDNFKKNWKSTLIAFHYLLLITSFILYYLAGLDLFQNKYLYYLIIGLYAVFVIFTLLFDKIYVNNTKRFLLVILPQTIALLIINLIFAFNDKLSAYVLLFILFTAVFMIASLGLYGDKNYGRRIIIDFLILIIISFIFGNKIYGLVPYKIGGGSPYTIIIENDCLKKDIPSQADTLKVIYENKEKYLFMRDSIVFAVSREEVKCFYIMN